MDQKVEMFHGILSSSRGPANKPGFICQLLPGLVVGKMLWSTREEASKAAEDLVHLVKR